MAPRRKTDSSEPEAPSTDEAAGETYTIDELAAHSGVPSRTIRFYQAQKLLERPRRRGRVAVYDAAHVERLVLIARMQDRGLRLRGMKQLLARRDSEAAVSQWLGLSDKLSTPWSDDRPRVVDEAELRALIGDRPDGTLGALLRAGLVERRDDAAGAYLIASPGLLEVAMRLVDAGLSIEVLTEIEPILRAGMRDAAAGVVAHFAHQRTLEGGSEESLTRALDALRTHGANAVNIIFAQEIERSLSTLLEDADALGKAARRKRPRRRREARQARRRDS